MAKEIERCQTETDKIMANQRITKDIHELPTVGAPILFRKGNGEMNANCNMGKVQNDDESIFNTSFIGQEDEVHRFATASPLSSIPNIQETVSDGAWRATVLPVLATSPDLLVWETSERYTAWRAACHIKLGVAGA